MHRKLKFQKGERVVTKFGSGFVVDVRLQEKIYEINLRRLRFRGFFHESSVEPFPYERVTHLVVDGRTIPAPELPKNTPEFKRRAVINEAIKAAREGKMFDASTPDQPIQPQTDASAAASTAAAETEEQAPTPASESVAASAASVESS